MELCRAGLSKHWKIVVVVVKGNKKNWPIAFCIVLALALFWGWRERSFRDRAPSHPVLQGETMGTYYSIKLVYSPLDRQGLEELEKSIKAELDAVEGSMSTYDSDSEISAFNRAPAEQSFALSDEFVRLLTDALAICRLTDGAFDPTVGPLVDLWGFGKKGRSREMPSEKQIESVKLRTGWEKLVREESSAFSKRVRGLEVDLSGIAKGYAVDRVASAIRSVGFANFMVEIGGEVYAAGLNSTGIPWRIGIDAPALDAVPGDRLHGIIGISDLAVATSGDYRNYFKSEAGKLYSHIIDPRTGYPVRMPPASVTVVGKDCMTVDALATALFVLGEKRGLELVEEIDGVEALYIISDYGTRFRQAASSGFYEATNYQSVE